MSKYAKVLIACLTLLMNSFCYNILGMSAHTKSLSPYLWGESNVGTYKFNVGWAVSETMGHSGGTSINYKFASDITEDEKKIFKSAVAKWTSSSAKPTITESTSGKGTITGFRDTASSAPVGFFTSHSKDSNNHTTKWEIGFNRLSNRPTFAILAHEIGHVFGLRDLYFDENKSKIMYAYTSTTATGPTTYDIKGFSIITGKYTYK